MSGSTLNPGHWAIAILLGFTPLALAQSTDGKPADGLQCQIAITRVEYAPGEELELQAQVQNIGNDTLLLPRAPIRSHDRFGRIARLCLVTPRGQKWVKQAPWPGPSYSQVNYQELKPTWSSAIGIESFRLLSNPPGWVLEPNPVGTSNTKLSLRADGKYRLWVEFESAPLRDAPPKAWAGKIRSNEVTFKIRGIPVHKRLHNLTPEQVALLNRFLQSGGKDSADLRRALQRTENEGLALEAVKRLRAALESGEETAPRWWSNLHFFLQERACEWGAKHLRIDGFYLRELTELQLAVLERAEKQTQTTRWPSPPPEALLVYLGLDRRNSMLVQRVVLYAERNAKLPQTSPANESGRPPSPPTAHGNFWLAWEILVRSGRLHDGIKLAETEQILGPPTNRYDKSVGWYAASPNRVNPSLWARVRDDRLYDWVRR